MPGLREAGLVGAAVALAGGVAYVTWNWAALSARQKPEDRVEREAEKQLTETGEVLRETGEEPRETGEELRETGEELRETGEELRETAEELRETAEELRETGEEPRETGEELRETGKELRETGKEPRETEKEPIKDTSVVPEEKPSSKQVLVLGLDGAGKTSLLHCLATGTLEQNIAPTKGFNAVSINKEDLKIEFLEIGGSEDLRAYWKMYLCKAEVLVYVVDSSDPTRFPLAKTHLHELIAEYPRLSLVVLANKQDVEGACGITDLHEALGLEGVGDQRKLLLIGTHVSKDDSEIPSSVRDARDLIVQMMSDAN